MTNLFGLQENHLTLLEENIFIHQDVEKDFLALCEQATGFQIELKIISGFRSFERQKMIWNKNLSVDSDKNALRKRLRWSAIPGLSRHHWGTDFDVIDQAALNKNSDYKVLLEPHEYENEGIFSHLGDFLNEHLNASAFFRPYEKDLGGVAKEPWHLSHRKVAQRHFEKLDFTKAHAFIHESQCDDIHGIDLIRKDFKNIFESYVINVC